MKFCLHHPLYPPFFSAVVPSFSCCSSLLSIVLCGDWCPAVFVSQSRRARTWMSEHTHTRGRPTQEAQSVHMHVHMQGRARASCRGRRGPPGGHAGRDTFIHRQMKRRAREQRSTRDIHTLTWQAGQTEQNRTGSQDRQQSARFSL